MRIKIPYIDVLNGTPLKEADHMKYLGILFSKDLKWNKHIDVTKQPKPNSLLGSSNIIWKLLKVVCMRRHTLGLYALRSNAAQQFGTLDQV